MNHSFKILILILLSITAVSAQQTLVDNVLTITDHAIYSTAYISADGQEWEQVELQGNSRGDWVVLKASTDIDVEQTPHVATYSCSWNRGWQCPPTWQIANYDTEAVILVENNQPRADIIVSSDATNSVQLAAELLQEYLYNMTGANLQINNAPNNDYEFHVYVGESEYTQNLGITSEGTRDGGYKIIAQQNHLVLLGDDKPVNKSRYVSQEEWDAITAPDKFRRPTLDRREENGKYGIHDLDAKGSMNAVHEFLRTQGMRWYHPNDFGVIIPDKKDIRVTHMSETVNPAFPMRALRLYYMRYGHLREGIFPDDYPWGSAEDQLRWVLALQKTSHQQEFMNGGVHALNAVLTREEVRETNPEYFAVWNGKRMDGSDGGEAKQNLCSQELLEATIRYAKHFYDVYDTDIVSVWPSDGFTRVSQHSQECIDKADPERGGDGVISNYVWDFTNEVAWAIADDPNYGPEYKVIQGAYSAYKLPPTELTDSRGMAPNVLAWITKWRSRTADEDFKEFYRTQVNDWLEILPSNQIYTYDYYLHHGSGRTTSTTPYFFPNIIQEDLQFLEGKSRGEYTEITGNWGGNNLEYDSYAAQAFNIWLTARLYWNPDADLNAMLDEYYPLYYGPAAQTMRELHEYSEANIPELTRNPVHKQAMRDLVQEALSEVPSNSVYEERIQNLQGFLNHEFVGDEAVVDSCQVLNSPGTTYKLQLDVSAEESCFLIDANGITLDCQEHQITYRTAGPSNSYGVQILARDTNRGFYSTIQNCNILDGSLNSGDTSGYGIQVGHLDYVSILDNTITVAGRGISTGRSSNITVRGNTVEAKNIGFTMFNGNSDKMSSVSEYLVEDNYFQGGNRGAYLYRNTDDIIRNNVFVGGQEAGLWAYYPLRTQLINNTFSSESGRPLRLPYAVDVTQENNNIIE